MPKVSVIIPVYNVEKYLRECLDSVVNQTLKDLEIICVDDGSTDGSPAILAEYAAKDPRVKVIAREKSNAGAARNAGMAVATGEYLGFVDSDDWCELTLFEKAAARADASGADVVLWLNDQFDVGRNAFTSPFSFPLTPQQIAEPVSPREIRNVLFTAFRFAPWCRLVRRDLVIRSSIRFQEIDRSNDVMFGCLALAAAGRIALVNESLYHYRTGTGLNLQAGNDRSNFNVIDAWLATGVALRDRGLFGVFRLGFLNAAVNSFFYTLSTLRDPDRFRTLFARVREELRGGCLFAGLQDSEIRDGGTRAFLRYLRESDDAMTFLLQVAGFDRRRFSTLWLETNDLRHWYRQVESERREAAEAAERRRTQPLVSVAVRDGLSEDLEAVRRQLPDGSEVFAWSRHGASEAAARRQTLEKTSGRYVAFIRAGERYVSDRIAEIMMRTAWVSNASVCGGRGGMSAFFFLRDWLLADQTGLLDLEGDDEFLSHALARDPGSLKLGRAVILSRIDVLLQASVEPGEELAWAEEIGRLMFQADRLDIAGGFLARLRDVIEKSPTDRQKAGEFINRIGYPYLEALVPTAARRQGTLSVLRNWSGLAAGSGRAVFGERSMPALSVGAVTVPPEPGVSVIMPVYNCEAYLIRAIESVRKQTSSDWELVCVDDGSVDRSPEILDWYASVDPRIRVFHKSNSGVSDTRNLGMENARGRYVTFLDGDDWYAPTMVEEVLTRSDADDLDVCFFDFRCCDYVTLEPKYHFWTFAHLLDNWGVKGRVFSADELKKWWWYGSLCQMAWRRSFLIARAASFPHIPLGEDVSLMGRLFPFVRKAFIIDRPFYNYQRGAPTSAVSRFGREKGPAFISKYETLLEIYRDVYLKETDAEARWKFLGRIVSDIIYDCTVAPVVKNWMLEVGAEEFGLKDIPPEYILRPIQVGQLQKLLSERPSADSGQPQKPVAPWWVDRTMRRIEADRAKKTRRDLYLVVSQLTSLRDEAIDAWSFFVYLKELGVEARFVTNRKHRRFAEFKAQYPKDVIGLSDTIDLSYDFIRRCRKELVRARAVAVEWTLQDPSVMGWLSSLKGLTYTFLQHGLTYNPPRKVHQHWWRPFNLINFCSVRERDMVLDAMGNPPEISSVVAGLPRWDLLRDEQDRSNRVLFVMLTWRPTYNIRPGDFAASSYCLGLRRLFSEDNLAKLKASGVTVKIALHHALREIDRGALDFGPDVEVVSAQTVSYWIRHASCLLTDFSSVSFDFLYLKKPVVYWIPDRYDQLLSPADREKVMVADGFLKKFLGLAHSADEAIDRLVAIAANGYALSPEQLKVIEPFFSSGGEFRRRIYEAVEKMDRREVEA